MMKMQEEHPMFNYNYLFKLVVVGDSTVGKSSFLKKLVNYEFKDITEPTIGVDFFTHTVTLSNTKIIKSHLWDTAGQEAFRSIIRNYYRNAAGIFLMYDISNRNSFDSLNYWVREINDMDIKLPIVLIGNKTDMRDSDKSTHVSEEEGREFATKHNFMFLELSNKTSSDHNNTYKQIIQYFYDELNLEQKENQQLVDGVNQFSTQGVTKRDSIKITKPYRGCNVSRENCCCIS